MAIGISFFLLWMLLFQLGLDRFGGSKLLGMQGLHILNLGGFFVAGVLLAIVDFKSWNSLKIIFSALLVLVISLYGGFFEIVKHVVFPIVILGLGFKAIPGVSSFGKLGDPSYGIYIYAFPIQQLLIFYFSPDLISFIVLSGIISIIFGYLSWHMVEKKALKFKSN